MARRQRPRPSKFDQGFASPRFSQLRPAQTDGVVGPASRRSALRPNREFDGAEIGTRDELTESAGVLCRAATLDGIITTAVEREDSDLVGRLPSAAAVW